MTERSPRALYLHIPFCHARCGYCDFVTFTGKEDRIDAYVLDLCREIVMHAKTYPETRVPTIFFGGGTPSLLEARHVEAILGAIRSEFELDPNCEITLEANPESLTLEKAKGWRAAGVNRLSIGLQAYDDRLLKLADRLHTVKDFENAFHSARQAGFDNMNVDLIYGLPGQSLADWRETLEKTAALRPEHLSLYALKVEQHTPFHAAGVTVNDDTESEMYEWARMNLSKKGYGHYEVSNFSKPSKECRHNMVYWRQEDYLGVGVGAVGCVAGTRWENHKNLADYGKDVAMNELPRLAEETLSEETLRFERLMLGLRLREGLSWEESDPERRAQRKQLVDRKLLEEMPTGRWRVPAESILLTNQAILPFLQ